MIYIFKYKNGRIVVNKFQYEDVILLLYVIFDHLLIISDKVSKNEEGVCEKSSGCSFLTSEFQESRNDV